MGTDENIVGVTLSQVRQEGDNSVEDMIWKGMLTDLESTIAAESAEPGVLQAGKVDEGLKIGKEILKFLEDNTGYDVAASSTSLLHTKDPNGLDYRPSVSWRSPASKWHDWKVAFWGTAGAIPLAGFQFYFDVTNQAVPAAEAKALGVPMGYYIPNFTCTPHAIVALPGYWMSAEIHFSNPTATIVKVKNEDFLLPQVNFSLSVKCNRFGIFKNTKVWAFKLAGNSNEVVSTL